MPRSNAWQGFRARLIGLEIGEIFSVTIEGVTNNVDLDHLKSNLDQY